MTPKEKAKKLFDIFNQLPVNYDTAKDCAKIHVMGIIELLSIDFTSIQESKKEFWNDVLREIKNL